SIGVGTHAQETFPARPITFVVPISSGTTIDILARLYAESFGATFRTRPIVANRPGAGGAIAAASVAAAPADGYTIIFVNSGHTILKYFNKGLAYDPVRDFTGVALIGKAPAVVVVPAPLPATSLRELVALGKSKPG